jgi:hypothetical protein
MYIHTYQIHNVLDVYRKQLIQGPNPEKHRLLLVPVDMERLRSNSGQRQSLIDQISAEIVERIVQTGPPRELGAACSDSVATHEKDAMSPKKEAEFTYTAIDENNCKRTNTLGIEELNPLIVRAALKRQSGEQPG